MGVNITAMDNYIDCTKYKAIFYNSFKNHPYRSGFIKFALLATMGDLLGTRISMGNCIIPKGLLYKAIIWGMISMMISLVFTVFMQGTRSAQTVGLLPFEGLIFAQAFFGSTIMNLTFGPMLMVYHKFLDLFVDVIYKG